MKKFFLQRLGVMYLSLLVLSLGGGCASAIFIPADRSHNQYEISSEIPADPAIETYIAPYKIQLESEMNKVIGRSEVRLTKSRNQPETLLGNFFTDALLQQGRKYDPEIDFSFGTSGGLRTELPEGDLTVGHLFELMPFENKLSILELTTESVEQVAQFIASSNGQPVSGLTMEIHNGNARNIQIGGQPLQKGQTYKLLTYDYLANGGDNSRGLDAPVSRADLPQKVRETLIEYIIELTENNQSINTKLDGRVKISQ